MTVRQKLSSEARFLIREYALRVARKAYPGATIEVHVGHHIEDDGRVERRVTVVPEGHQE
jgi:hypothetical protein